MTGETIGVIVAVAIGRLWSMWEHRKTGKEVKEIKIYFNGELEKKLKEAKEEGREEEINKNKK